MATIDEVKAELERRGAIMPAERPCGKLTGDGRYWQFMFYKKDGGCTWDYVGLQDMSKPAAAIVDRMWPESVGRDIPEEITNVVCYHSELETAPEHEAAGYAEGGRVSETVADLRIRFINVVGRLPDEQILSEVRQLIIDAIDILEQTPLERRLLNAIKALEGGRE